MADPMNLDIICDELGVSRQEALFYLEGFKWDLVLAMNACRRKLLPPLKAQSSPQISVIAKPPDEPEVINPHKEEISSGSSVVINLQKNEISSQKKKELIDSFREVAVAMPLTDVVELLERFNWDLNLAVNKYMDLTYSTPDEFMYSGYLSGNDDTRRASDQAISEVMTRFSSDEPSSHLATNFMDLIDPSLRLLPSESHQIQNYLNRAHIGSSSSSLMNVDVAYTGDELKEADGEAISQVKILESSCPDQIMEEPEPQFKVDRICNEIGVCREEALFYLEGFNWNSDLAMKASRSKALPPAKVESSPGVSVNEKSMAPSTSVVINSRRISNEKQNQTESLPPQLKEELINQFCSVAVGASRVEAIACLNSCLWSLQDAIIDYTEMGSETPNSQHMSEYHHTIMGQSSSQNPRSREDVTSKSLAPQSQLQASGNSSFSFMNIDPTETETSLEEVTVAIPPMDIQESSSSAQKREKLLSPIGNTLAPLKIRISPSMTNSPRISSQRQRQSRQRERLSPQQKEEFISQFCNVVGLGVSTEDAIAYLNRCNWSLGDAILHFMDVRTKTLDSQPISEYDHSLMGQLSSQSPSSPKDVTSKSLSPQSQLEVQESSSSAQKREKSLNRDIPVHHVFTRLRKDLRSRTLNSQHMSEYDHSIMGQSSSQSPSSKEDVTSKSLTPQLQLQASGSSSSSLMNIDSTETEKSVKEGGDASATVAITPMTTSQVDRNLKDKAVEEHSSKEAVQAAPNTVTLDITFHDGTVLEIPFRKDQTIRDIRNKIEVLRPDDSGDYYFMCKTGADYKDLNTPVRKIIQNSFSLMQIYPD